MEKIKFEDVEVGDTVCEVVETADFSLEVQFKVTNKTSTTLENYSLMNKLSLRIAKEGELDGTLYLVKKRDKKAAEFPIATTIITRTNHKNDTRSYVKTAVKVAKNQWFMMTDGEWHSVGKDETLDKYELQEKDVKVLLPDGTEFEPNKG